MDYQGKKFHFDTRYWDAPQKYQSFSLYQIGDLSCMSGFEVGDHLQVCYEISYIFSGKGRFYLDGNEYSVQAGDLFLCKPNQLHNLVADTADPFRYLYFAFFFQESTDFDNPFIHVEKMLRMVKNPCIQDSQAISIPFTNVLKELHNPKELSQPLIETYFTQIILLTYRNFFGGGFDVAAKNIDSFVNPIVYSAISYIDNNLCEITSLSDVAAYLNYSYSHLAHIFADETGMSLQGYYNKRRIETAISLLTESGMSVNDIAFKLQYQSIHSFSKAFKKALGMAPSQYRSFKSVSKSETETVNSVL